MFAKPANILLFLAFSLTFIVNNEVETCIGGYGNDDYYDPCNRANFAPGNSFCHDDSDCDLGQSCVMVSEELFQCVHEDSRKLNGGGSTNCVG